LGLSTYIFIENKYFMILNYPTDPVEVWLTPPLQ